MKIKQAAIRREIRGEQMLRAQNPGFQLGSWMTSPQIQARLDELFPVPTQAQVNAYNTGLRSRIPRLEAATTPNTPNDPALQASVRAAQVQSLASSVGTRAGSLEPIPFGSSVLGVLNNPHVRANLTNLGQAEIASFPGTTHLIGDFAKDVWPGTAGSPFHRTIGNVTEIAQTTAQNITNPDMALLNLGLAWGGASGLAGAGTRGAAAIAARGVAAEAGAGIGGQTLTVAKALASRPNPGYYTAWVDPESQTVISSPQAIQNLGLPQEARHLGLHEVQIAKSQNPLVRAFRATVYPPDLERLATRAYAVDQKLANREKVGMAGREINSLIREKARIQTNAWRQLRRTTPEEKARVGQITADLVETQQELLRIRGEPTLPVAAWDAINKATVISVLYLKPGYLLPNLMGQGFLSAVQHHWNPLELAKTSVLTFRMAQDLGRANHPVMQSILARVSPGQVEATIPSKAVFAGVRQAGGARVLQPTARALRRGFRGLDVAHKIGAASYGMVLDTPWRLSSFMYHARKAGFDNPEKIQQLVMEPRHTAAYNRISREANRDMIEYDTMSEAERQVVRRVLFFYPWLRGSTEYAARFTKEHPVQAAVQGQIGEQAKEYAAGFFRKFGIQGLPSFAQGLYPAGTEKVPGLGVVPRATNPASAAILGQPAQLGLSALELLTGSPTAGAEAITSLITPAISTLNAAITGKDLFSGRTIGPPGIGTAVKELGQQLKPPLLSAIQYHPTAKERQKFVYPSSHDEKMRQVIYGSAVAARPVNPKAITAKYRVEVRSTLSPVKRITFDTNLDKKELLSGLKQTSTLAGETPGDPKVITAAVTLNSKRAINRLLYAKSHKTKVSDLTTKQKFEADLAFMVRNGKIPKKEALQLTRDFRNADDSHISRELGKFTSMIIYPVTIENRKRVFKGLKPVSLVN